MSPSDMQLFYGLTAKQALFVWAYLGPARLNATRAALMAKYSPRNPRQAGYQVLQNERVREALRFLSSQILLGIVREHDKKNAERL